MKVLIVYGTTYGQTAKVAASIASVATAMGRDVKTVTAASAPSPEEYDVVFVGGSIHFGAFQKEVQAYVAQHDAALDQCRTSLFCVSGSARSEEGMEEAEEFSETLLKDSAWTPDHIEHIAGAFPFSQYPLWKRWLMRFFLRKQDPELDTSEDLDFTDWPKVEEYARRVLEEQGASSSTNSGVTNM